MRVAGIIAEYNPFHNGHAYQIRKIREDLHSDYIIAVMSPDFVQRGSFAVCSKYVRTQMALRGGIDLVLELPVRRSSASAQIFATGGVGMLDALGCVNDLVFGCEAEKPELLAGAARLLSRETPDFQNILHTALTSGQTFPAAREAALRKTAGTALPELLKALNGGLLRQPNNILAVEYLSALTSLHSSMKPYMIRRSGGEYHASSGASAQAIRQILEKEASSVSQHPGEQAFEQIRAWMPAESFELLHQTLLRYGLPSRVLYEAMLRYRLLTDPGYEAFEDVSPELSLRIRRFLPSWQDGESFAANLKSRQYTRTRIDRALLHLFLGLRKKDPVPEISYARILGFRQDALPLLHQIRLSSRIPLISKCASAETLLPPDALPQFQEDILASHLYQLLFHEKKGEHEYTHSPVILP